MSSKNATEWVRQVLYQAGVNDRLRIFASGDGPLYGWHSAQDAIDDEPQPAPVEDEGGGSNG